MDKPQTKFLIGLAAGTIAASGAFLSYNSVKFSADEVKSDSKAICDSKTLKADTKAIKGDDGKYYKSDVKASLNKDDIKTDAKIIKYDGKIYQTDGIKYDAKPELTEDGKIFKSDEKYLKTDGKNYATLDTSKIDIDAKLLKVDGKIVAKSDELLKSDGKVFLLDNETIVCNSEGTPVFVDVANDATVIIQLASVEKTASSADINLDTTIPSVVSTNINANAVTTLNNSATVAKTVITPTPSLTDPDTTTEVTTTETAPTQNESAPIANNNPVIASTTNNLTIPAVTEPKQNVAQIIFGFFDNLWSGIKSIF
ncbi:MAG: hypothetical protein WCO23_00950 [bacterium]